MRDDPTTTGDLDMYGKRERLFKGVTFAVALGIGGASIIVVAGGGGPSSDGDADDARLTARGSPTVSTPAHGHLDAASSGPVHVVSWAER